MKPFTRVILLALLAPLLALLPSREACGQELKRGFELKSPTVYVAKGSWIAGGNARYSCTSYADGRIAVVGDVNSDSYTAALTPSIAYCINDNFALGLRGSYTRSLLKIDSAQMSFGELSLAVDDYYSLSHSGSLMLFCRPYMPMGQSGRFAMFVDVAAGIKRGQAKVSDGHSGFTAGTWQQSSSWSVGVYPGLSAFLGKRVALEFQIGMLGFDSTKLGQVHNQVSEGTRSSFSATYMADLTSLALGVTICL